MSKQCDGIEYLRLHRGIAAEGWQGNKFESNEQSGGTRAGHRIVRITIIEFKVQVNRPGGDDAEETAPSGTPRNVGDMICVTLGSKLQNQPEDSVKPKKLIEPYSRC